MNSIGGVMVSVRVCASSVVDRGSSPFREELMTIKFIFVASPLSTQHLGERDWLARIGIMCPSGATCPPGDYGCSELAV